MAAWTPVDWPSDLSRQAREEHRRRRRRSRRARAPASASCENGFIDWFLRDAHRGRRCWVVVRVATAIARRVVSGSSVGPSSSQATRIASGSRGAWSCQSCLRGFRSGCPRRSPRAGFGLRSADGTSRCPGARRRCSATSASGRPVWWCRTKTARCSGVKPLERAIERIPVVDRDDWCRARDGPSTGSTLMRETHRRWRRSSS